MPQERPMPGTEPLSPRLGAKLPGRNERNPIKRAGYWLHEDSRGDRFPTWFPTLKAVQIERARRVKLCRGQGRLAVEIREVEGLGVMNRWQVWEE